MRKLKVIFLMSHFSIPVRTNSPKFIFREVKFWMTHSLTHHLHNWYGFGFGFWRLFREVKGEDREGKAWFFNSHGSSDQRVVKNVGFYLKNSIFQNMQGVSIIKLPFLMCVNWSPYARLPPERVNQFEWNFEGLYRSLSAFVRDMYRLSFLCPPPKYFSHRT